MFAQQLIGKKALRTKPTNYNDHSYMTTPILILAATENHIVYQYVSDNDVVFNTDSKRVLDYRWNDDNWTDYDELMLLADEKHIQLMSELNDLS